MGEAPTPLPDFLIIGAQKSATRWLRHNLGLHPDVFAAPRELEFFNTERFEQIGLGGYAKMFEGWHGEAHVGEATPGYMMLRESPAEIAARIDRSLPDVRLVAILRNPVDRIQSAVLHHLQRGRIPEGVSALAYVSRIRPERDPWGIVAGSWYAECLRPYVELFGTRLLVLLQDDALAEPRRVYRQACLHIGIEDEFVPKALTRIRFSNREEPDEGIPVLDELSVGERAVLMGYVRDEIDALEDLLQLDLSRWRLGAEYTPEIRRAALSKILVEDDSVADVADQLSVPVSLVTAWRDRALAEVVGAER